MRTQGGGILQLDGDGTRARTRSSRGGRRTADGGEGRHRGDLGSGGRRRESREEDEEEEGRGTKPGWWLRTCCITVIAQGDGSKLHGRLGGVEQALSRR